MEPILTDTIRFRVARVIAQRNAYLEQRDRLASAIADHCSRHPHEAHDADSQLWEAFEYVMGRRPGGLKRPAVRP
ncbi:MAG TPA: hypothetical protein VGI67_15735 [Thermoleophilaceae bacterium]|jgi:hypothetical protein